MKYLLMTEYETMKVYELDNVIHKKIEYKLVKLTGSEMIAKKIDGKVWLSYYSTA